MIASDFLLQVRDDLQEKSRFWSDENLLAKLQRSYLAIQHELPFFIRSRELTIQKGVREYYLDNVAIKNVKLSVVDEHIDFNYVSPVYFYTAEKPNSYTFEQNKIIVSDIDKESITASLVYYYEKELENANCVIELPNTYMKALRYLLMSEIYEKPTGNSKSRDLNSYYLNLYMSEIEKLKHQTRMRPKNITSKYQRV